MIILGIETSCDDTAAAVLQGENRILSNIISSQAEFHEKYGGVVPEIASRKHQENIAAVVNEALNQADINIENLDALAVTQGPGLIGSLLVGINFAKAIAYSSRKPIVGINHLEGHLLAPFLQHSIPLPCITLVVSGGHTNLYHVKSRGNYMLLGSTRDDAAGEAFDKVAKLLGLGYPGGIIIDRLSKQGNPNAINFPRPMLNDPSLDFSFSGLKTAVLYHTKKIAPQGLSKKIIQDIAASFQKSVIEILVEKTIRAALINKVKSISIAGGVASNSMLREEISRKASHHGIEVFIPSPVLCTDNAAMIALAGSHRIKLHQQFPFSMNAISRWPL